MKIHREYQQQSTEWMIARAGVVTASEFDNIVTPEFKVRTGQTPASYLAKKLAERWLGGPIVDFNTFDMMQGEILESEGIPFYELEYGEPIERVGFITTDDGKVGCSPDGLLPDGSGIEVKCPAVHTHIGYLLRGELPKDYAAQVHGAMFVTGAKSWKFMSYRRRFPALVLTVERDEEIQEKLSEAIADFLGLLEGAMEALIVLNGGPPVRPTPRAPEPELMPNLEDVPH